MKALKASAEFQITSWAERTSSSTGLSDCALPADSAQRPESSYAFAEFTWSHCCRHLEKSAERSFQDIRLISTQDRKLVYLSQLLGCKNTWGCEGKLAQNVRTPSGWVAFSSMKNQGMNWHEVIQQSASWPRPSLLHRGPWTSWRRQQSSAGLEAAMEGDGLQQDVDAFRV